MWHKDVGKDKHISMVWGQNVWPCSACDSTQTCVYVLCHSSLRPAAEDPLNASAFSTPSGLQAFHTGQRHQSNLRISHRLLQIKDLPHRIPLKQHSMLSAFHGLIAAGRPIEWSVLQAFQLVTPPPPPPPTDEVWKEAAEQMSVLWAERGTRDMKGGKTESEHWGIIKMWYNQDHHHYEIIKLLLIVKLWEEASVFAVFLSLTQLEFFFLLLFNTWIFSSTSSAPRGQNGK